MGATRAGSSTLDGLKAAGLKRASAEVPGDPGKNGRDTPSSAAEDSMRPDISGTTSIIRGTEVYPSWTPGSTTLIQWNPIDAASLGTDFRTHSFFVNDQKMAWFDFSSQKNGNIFDFVMQTEGVNFPEAVERLASMAGVPLPRVTPEAEAREERRKTLHDVLEAALLTAEGALDKGW